MDLGSARGAGSWNHHRHFGVPISGVYLADNFETAMHYPMTTHTYTGRLQECKSGVGGGEVIAGDGTPPLKVVFRRVVDPTHYLFFAGNLRAKCAFALKIPTSLTCLS